MPQPLLPGVVRGGQNQPVGRVRDRAQRRRFFRTDGRRQGWSPGAPRRGGAPGGGTHLGHERFQVRCAPAPGGLSRSALIGGIRAHDQDTPGMRLECCGAVVAQDVTRVPGLKDS